jgi:hypothetical protein
MKRLGLPIVAASALLWVLAAAGTATATAARTPNGSPPLAFCTALLRFDAGWPQVNLDHPGQPFFSDGNNDGIADLLQVGRAKLPGLASGLEDLSTQAPSDLRGGIRALAADIHTLTTERAPTTAAESSREVKPTEQVASGVQRRLRSTGCLGKVTAANAAADQAEQGTSGSSGQGKTVAAVLVFLLVNLPLVRRVWRHSRRPALKADGSGFKGNLRRWEVDTVTGRVRNVERSTVILTTSGVHTDPGQFPRGSTVWTETEVLRLVLADGSQTDVPLVNFSAYPTKGDMVTVCSGRKRSRTMPFALLNHTTKGQTVQLQNLFTLREGGTARQVIMVFGLIFGGLVTAFIAVFGGALWLVAVWLGLMALFVVTSRREASIDVRPLWRRAQAELEKLPA